MLPPPHRPGGSRRRGRSPYPSHRPVSRRGHGKASATGGSGSGLRGPGRVGVPAAEPATLSADQRSNTRRNLLRFSAVKAFAGHTCRPGDRRRVPGQHDRETGRVVRSSARLSLTGLSTGCREPAHWQISRLPTTTSYSTSPGRRWLPHRRRASARPHCRPGAAGVAPVAMRHGNADLSASSTGQSPTATALKVTTSPSRSMREAGIAYTRPESMST